MRGTRLKSHSPLLCGQINTYFPHSDHGSCRCGQCFISVQSLGVVGCSATTTAGNHQNWTQTSIFWLANVITLSLGEQQHISYPFILKENLIPFLFADLPVSKYKFTLLTKSEAWTERCNSFLSYRGCLISGWVKFKTDFVINILCVSKFLFSAMTLHSSLGSHCPVCTTYLPEGCPYTS